MKVQTSSVHPQTVAPESRTLEEIEREVTALQRRKADFARDVIPALEADVTHAKEQHRRALVEAVRADRETPSREGVEKAEAALRHGQEQLAAFDGVIDAIEPERRAAQDRQERARRDELAAERVTLRADVVRLRAEALAATNAADEADARIQSLNFEIQRLAMRVGPPSQA